MTYILVGDVVLDDVILDQTTQVEVVDVKVDTCHRSGSAWYVDLACDRGGTGTWLPKRNWAPLVFFVLFYLFCMFVLAIDDSLTMRERSLQMIFSLLFFIIFGAIIVMLVLKNHTGWAWFVALLPFIIFLLSIIVGLFMFLFGGACPHCSGTCVREH